MALVTSTEPNAAWTQIKGNAKQLKINLGGMNSRLAAGNVTIEQVFEIYQRLSNSKNQLVALSSTRGIDAYVKTLRDDVNYVATTQIAAATDAIQAALDWINTNTGGLSLTGDTAANAIANSSVATNRFSAGQTSGLRTLITAIDATIS